MQLSRKKIGPYATALFVMATAFLQADDTSSMMPSTSSSNNVAPAPAPSMPSNPSSRPQVKDGVDLFLTGDWLIWQGNESGLAYVIKSEGTSSTTITDGHAKSPEFEYEFGFRVGLGYNLPHDGWDLYANWTWFHDRAHGHSSVEGSSDDQLFTTFASPGSSGPNTADEASSHLHVRLNVIDLELGREFATSKWLSLRPFAGLRTAWVNQHFEAEYENVSTLSSPSTVSFSEYETEMKNDYWGLGLRGGLNTEWGFGSGWSFYGDAAISLLYGNFKLHYEEESTVSGVESLQKSVHNSFHATRAITDLGLGLRWDYMFFSDAFHIRLQAGWEHHMYFSQNQIMRFVSSNQIGEFVQNQGDLGFQGWTIAARFDF